MADNSKIEWTDATWNPIVGCSHASRGCDHCYAERMAWRLAQMGQEKYQAVAAGEANDNPALDVDDLTYRGVWKGKTFFDQSVLDEPIRWKKRRKIFVCSMGDLFHQSVPFEWVDRVIAIILAGSVLTNHRHTYQVLTKRPRRMKQYFDSRDPVGHLKAWAKAGDGLIHLENEDELFSEAVESLCWAKWHPTKLTAVTDGAAWSHPENLFPLKNLWLGTTAEDQAAADERIPLLLQCPAAVRFVSVEPMLSSVDLTPWLFNPQSAIRNPQCLDWVICGGETGPGSRPMHPAWVLSLRDQCKAAGVPFFFKSWGDWQPHPIHRAFHATHFVCEAGHFDRLNDDRLAKHRDGDCCMASTIGTARVGKKAAGNLINGVQWHELPREVNHD